MSMFELVCQKMIVILLVACLQLASYQLPVGAISAPTLEEYGILNVTSHQIRGLPHAVGDGVTDDTAALQALLDYGHRNRMVVLVPSGTYLISDTLDMMDDNLAHKSDTQSFVLIGSTLGTKPVLRLQDHARGFDDVDEPKPILKMWRKCGSDAREDVSNCIDANDTVDGEGLPASYFSDGIRNLIVIVGEGNPGAVGLYFAGAQDSFIEDITIDMTNSGYAGVTATPGPASVIGNITVLGGQYGITGNNLLRHTVMTNVKLINQTVAAIEARPASVLTLVGFEIQKRRAPAIQVSGGKGGIVLVDGKIDIAQNSNRAVVELDNSSSTSSLTNVYFNNTNRAIAIGDQVVRGGAKWHHLAEFYGESAEDSVGIVEQETVDSTIYTPLVATLREPEDLGRYHTWPHYNSPDHLLLLANRPDSGVCNALDPNDQFVIEGNGEHDDQPGLQTMIDSDNCEIIFVPKGDYFLGRTLTLRENTKLFGLSHSFTIFTPSKESTNSAELVDWQPTREMAFVTTVDSATATTMLADVRLRVPATPKERDWVTTFHWKAGKYSVVKNVFTNPIWSHEPQTNPKAEVRYSGNGGGKWFGAGAKGRAVGDYPASDGYRKLVISGTTQSLLLYNLNIEDGAACPPGQSLTCPENAWQAEVVNSKNVAIFGAKYENQKALKIENSENIGYFGSNIGNELGAYNNTNIVMASLSNAKSDNLQEWVLQIKEGDYEKTIAKNSYLTVYKNGEFDWQKVRVITPEILPIAEGLLPLFPKQLPFSFSKYFKNLS